MRTTISLDPDIEAAVERLRRKEGMGLSEAVNALARRGLVPGAPQERYVFTPRPMTALIDLTNVAEVLEMIEEGDRPR